MNNVQRLPGRTFPAIAALAMVLAVGATGYTITRLRDAATDSHQRTTAASSLESSIRTIDGIEWRAVAGGYTPELRGQFDAVVADLSDAEQDGMTPRLTAATDEFVNAVDAMLDAFENGDPDLAEEIDETRVDPAFEEVIEGTIQLREDAAATAASTEADLARLAWGVIVVLAVASGLLTFILADTRDRRRRSQTERDRLFRSLVEGSEDLFTLVNGDAEMVVLNRNSDAPLAGTSDTSREVSQFLTPDAYQRWRLHDEELQSTGHTASFEIALPAPDGETVITEAHGSLLITDPAQRVWVWRDITARKELELELELSQQAFSDPLTGLPNRSLLYDRISHALAIAARRADPVSLLFCDLDDFKQVNDSGGHSRGDEFLQIIAQRLQDATRPSDTVARLGGDEFAILIEHADREPLEGIAGRLLEAVAEEVDLDDHKFFPSMSIGIATSSPGTTVEDLLRSADLAMYAAKRGGKGRSERYDGQMLRDTEDHRRLQTDLRPALEEDQFELYFQPCIKVSTGAVHGVEALIRWNHPTRGLIAPQDFIHLAEASGMIIPIGRWVIQEACQSGVAIRRSGFPSSIISLNLSPIQLHDPGIVATVQSALQRSELPPEALVLEVTEGHLLDNPAAIERLHQLCELGVSIAVDDFGTGYASISYLRSLPISIVKIDRSFVSGNALEPDEQEAFLDALIGLTRSLELVTVAEGVETTEQLERIRALGSDAAQGYLWADALPWPDALRRMEEIDMTADLGAPGSPQPAALRASSSATARPSA